MERGCGVLTTMTLKRLASLGGSEDPMATTAAARRGGANPRAGQGRGRVFESQGGGWVVKRCRGVVQTCSVMGERDPLTYLFLRKRDVQASCTVAAPSDGSIRNTYMTILSIGPLSRWPCSAHSHAAAQKEREGGQKISGRSWTPREKR